eukprot:jgi/Botrbrau1/7589/Bobra.0159s0038.1
MVLKLQCRERSRWNTGVIGVVVVLGTLLVEAASVTLLSAFSSTQQGHASSDPASSVNIERAIRLPEADQGLLFRGVKSAVPGVNLQCPAQPVCRPETNAVWRSSIDLSDYRREDLRTCQASHQPAAEDAPASASGTDVEAAPGQTGAEGLTTSQGGGDPVPSGTPVAEPIPLDAKGDAPEEGQNFALGKEGAKIVAANKEARKADAILDCDGDTFLKNECKADKWLIIELSQVIKPTLLVLSQYELYSGRIQEFEVRVRQDHPRHDGTDYAAKLDSPAWSLVGRFTAANTKGSQSFRMPALMPWAKYLQLRVLSHYGVEAVCALNDVRVYGKSAIEDFEDSLVKQARGAEAHAAAFGHLGTLGTGAMVPPVPLLPPPSADAASQPSLPEPVPQLLNATAVVAPPTNGSLGTEVPPVNGTVTAGSGDQPASPPKDASQEPRQVPGGPERRDAGTPSSGSSPPVGSTVPKGAEPREALSEGAKGLGSPPAGPGPGGLPPEAHGTVVGDGERKEEGVSGAVSGDTQPSGTLGEGGLAGDQGGARGTTDLAPLSLEEWPSSTLVHGRQTTIFDMLVQDLKLVKLQQKLLPRQVADMHKNLSADVAALAAELASLASRIGLLPPTQLARKGDADAVKIMQLQMELAALQDSMRTMQRSQLGMGLLMGALGGLLVLRIPHIHQEHRLFKLAVMVLAVANGIVGLLLQHSGGLLSKNTSNGFRLVA